MASHLLGREPDGFCLEEMKEEIETRVENRLEGMFFEKNEVLRAFGDALEEVMGQGAGTNALRQTIQDVGILASGAT